MKKLLLTIFLVVLSASTFFATDIKKISPVLECVVENSDGTYTAWFGYNNPNDFKVDIAVGADNRFTPAPEDRGQTTSFKKGRQTYVFSINFDGSELVWTLNGKTSTASKDSKKCEFWDKSSLSFTGQGGNCEEIFASVKNGDDSGDMEGTTNWELYWILSGQPKDGIVIATGTIDALGAGESQKLTFIPELNPNGAAGVYMFKAYQREGHPGTGELWSEEITIEDNCVREKLKLTAMCWDAEEGLYEMRVRNENNYDIPFTWDIYGTSNMGSGVALANSDTFFDVPQTSYNPSSPTTVRIFVNTKLENTKATNGVLCEVPFCEDLPQQSATHYVSQPGSDIGIWELLKYEDPKNPGTYKDPRYVGLFKGGSADGDAYFYCIDLENGYDVSKNNPPTLRYANSNQFADWKIRYILENYFPYVNSTPSELTQMQEAAAVQLVIWNLVDGIDLTKLVRSNLGIAEEIFTEVKARALEILGNIPGSYNPKTTVLGYGQIYYSVEFCDTKQLLLFTGNNSCEEKVDEVQFSITGMAEHKIISMNIDGSFKNYYVGLMKGKYSGKDPVLALNFYCVDLQNILQDGFKPEYRYSKTNLFVNKYIRYILDGYHPYGGGVGTELEINAEAAAIQLAIWYFSDGLDIASKVNASVEIENRANAIITDAKDNAPTWVFNSSVSRGKLVVHSTACETSQKLVIVTGDDPLPVELTSFTANVSSNVVSLTWSTATEVNNYGFEIERNGEKIGFVEGNGNSNSPLMYSFTDNSATSGKFNYRLKQIDFDGKFEYSETIEVEVSAPEKFELTQNYPNPFNPTTNIRYSIDNPGLVKLVVFNILGEEVATLVNETKESGIYNVSFDASNLNSGIYIYRLESGNQVQMQKMMLVK